MSAVPNRLQEDSAVFDVRFWRSYRMLRFIACRVLGDPEQANKAVENCWQTASRSAPRFEHEGEFRSWLLRALIDEVLALLRNSQQTPKPDVLSEPLPEEVSAVTTCSVSNIDRAFQTKGDEMNSTQSVIENHIQRFREGDLDGVLADFSPEAVVFTPSGTLKGKSEIKTLFQNLLEEFGKAGASETVRTAIFEGDYAYLIWSGETVDNNYEFATDTFVVRNGKIVMQSFAAKVTPKR